MIFQWLGISLSSFHLRFNPKQSHTLTLLCVQVVSCGSASPSKGKRERERERVHVAAIFITCIFYIFFHPSCALHGYIADQFSQNMYFYFCKNRVLMASLVLHKRGLSPIQCTQRSSYFSKH